MVVVVVVVVMVVVKVAAPSSTVSQILEVIIMHPAKKRLTQAGIGVADF